MSDLIEKIQNHEVLKEYIVDACREGAAEVRIPEQIEEYCIVNPEKYFINQRLGDSPASVDFIITTLCRNHFHNHNLIELKSISTTLRGEDAKIYKKFEDTFDNFLLDKFKDIYATKKKRCFKFYLVHNIKSSSDLNLLKKLFMQPIKRNIGNIIIECQKSPFKLKRC